MRFAITCTYKRRKIGYFGIQTEINIIIRFKRFLSFDQLIDQLLLRNGPNFALIHAMNFHPFVALLCLELYSREEELWQTKRILQISQNR